MNTVPIPAWTAVGVLPPLNASSPVSPERSPYAVSLTDLVLRFGDTPERRTILEGYLRYRSALHAAGLDRGFQWLDGSFLENVELFEQRAPKDVDVVTFYHLPEGTTQADLQQRLGRSAHHESVKTMHRTDAYLVHLGMAPERLARQCAYWYSMWSHRRNLQWKGFVQVDQSATEDPAAMSTLASLSSPGSRP